MSDTGGLFPFDDAEEFTEDIVDEEEEYSRSLRGSVD